MFTYTIEVNQLDTITKHLIDINQQLLLIKKDTGPANTIEIIRTVGLVLSPFITGFIIFFLTRNKEHHQKRAELCGEIYSCLAEIKRTKNDRVSKNVLHNGFKRCYELLFLAEYEEKDKLMIRQNYDDAAIDYDKSTLAEDKALKNFLKYIGQYRFYLSKVEKKELDRLTALLALKEKLTYDFSDLTEMIQITKKMYVIIDAYNSERTETNAKMYSDIMKFIDYIEEAKFQTPTNFFMSL